MKDPPPDPGGSQPDVVEANHLVVTLGGTRVLDDCDLRLGAGLLHGLVGRGGSGKTTLLKTLATLRFPNSGTIRLFGVPVDPADREGLRSLRSRIGMQFQTLALFDFLDVGDNVAFPVRQNPRPPPPEVVEAEVEALLAAMGLPGTARLRLNEISGGMQRRVALARAVMGRPDLCLLDDPSAGLDPVNSSRIFKLLRAIQRERGMTMVVASHDVDRLARVCDRVHVLRAGRILFSGTVAEAIEADDADVRSFFPRVR